MAKLEDILKVEASRSALADYNAIHLFLEGSFLRAYEFSAWLCHRFIHEFTPTHRTNKGVDKDIIFVGFPLTSLQKWTPTGADCKEQEEKHFCILLRQELDEAGVEQMKDYFAEWKASVPIVALSAKKSDAKMHVTDNSMQASDASELVRTIMEFPIERKNMLECVAFLSSVREQAISILSNK